MKKKKGMRFDTFLLLVMVLGLGGYIFYWYLVQTNQTLFGFIKAVIAKLSGS